MGRYVTLTNDDTIALLNTKEAYTVAVRLRSRYGFEVGTEFGPYGFVDLRGCKNVHQIAGAIGEQAQTMRPMRGRSGRWRS